jgi:hypothetical protein
MQVLRAIDTETAALVGWGVRVMLLSPSGGEGPGRVADRIAGLGGVVEVETDLYAAIETLTEDATGYGLFVMECDGFGGVQAGRNAVSMLGRVVERMPVMLVSSEVAVQTFPEQPNAPVLLRAPLSSVALRVGFEHALRERLIYMAA